MEQKIIDQAIAHRQPLPDAIANAPSLFFGLDFYFRAFVELNSCRNSGMERGRIPWTALNDYSQDQDLTGDEKEDFIYLLQRIDDMYLQWAQEQDEKKRNKRPSPKPKRRK